MRENIVDLVKSLTPEQRRELVRLCTLQDEVDIEGLISTISNKSKCPHCGNVHIIKSGVNKTSKGDVQKFKCKSCSKIFSLKTKTLFAYSQKSIEMWKEYIDLMLTGKSLRKIAVIMNINVKTAFYWRHKVLTILGKKVESKLNGIVEADETYFRYSEKGSKKLTRYPRKRGGKSIYSKEKWKRGLSRDKVCVLCAIDRTKNSFGVPVGLGKMSAEQLLKNFSDRIEDKSILITDGEKSYHALSNKVVLQTLPTGTVPTSSLHLNNINSYHSGLKKFIDNFNGVATKYLDNYVNLFKAIRTNQDVFKDIMTISAECFVSDLNDKQFVF